MLGDFVREEDKPLGRFGRDQFSSGVVDPENLDIDLEVPTESEEQQHPSTDH